MEALLIARTEGPNRNTNLAKMRQVLEKAGIERHTEAPRLGIMVAAFTHTTTNLAIIIEPKDLEKLAGRIRAATTGKAEANAAFIQIAAEAKEFDGRKVKAYELPKTPDPIFIVVAKKRIAPKRLPAGVKSFAVDDAKGILAALHAAASPRNS